MPGLLPRLPLDPYSGQPFRYRRSGGQMLLPLGLSGLARTIQDETSRSQPSRPGQWLLYSVGPNRTDEEARRDYVNRRRAISSFRCLRRRLRTADPVSWWNLVKRHADGRGGGRELLVERGQGKPLPQGELR